jgi:geranylgeranyl diphosphate synthase type I
VNTPLDVADLRLRVQACLDAELAHQRTVLAPLGPDVDELVDSVERLISGGKRLRAALLYWGYRGAGRPDSPEAIRLASAMEFFQAAALLHDDVMDDSDTRRGLPAAHRALARAHGERGWTGDPERFGLSGAVLAGNLCLGWTDELYATCGLPAEDLARGRAVFDLMRTQLMAGQYLDVVESSRPWDSLSSGDRVERAERVIHYKSAKYSIEHPLLIGARAGGLGEDDLQALSAYGLALGHAFQLRDDVLGVFGDPATTGKPAGDDLREGKRTVLVAHTLAGANATDAARLEKRRGDPSLDEDGVEVLRAIIHSAGAGDLVEGEIEALAASAREHLKVATGVTEEAAGVLEDLIAVTTARHA